MTAGKFFNRHERHERHGAAFVASVAPWRLKGFSLQGTQRPQGRKNQKKDIQGKN